MNKLKSKINSFKEIGQSYFDDLLLKSKKKISRINYKNIFNKPGRLLRNAQDYVEKKVSNGNEEVVLNQSRFWARSISWTLIGGTTFGLGWLSLAKTEEIVVASGKLEPISGVIDVQMPLQGIAKEVFIEEGEYVKKGQILIKLDSEISSARVDSINTNLKISKKILDKYAFLLKEGAVSELQYLQQEAKVADIEKQRIESLVTLKYQEIISPEDGIVFDLQPKGPGFVARSSDPVLKIVPNNKLHAKVEVDSKDIGFVSLNKKADISIDSFPATDFGVLEGSVTKIGSDALPPDPRSGKGYRYPVQITLNSQKLKLKDGKLLPLQVGMSLNANIKLRKVSYLQLLLGTFKNKADTLKQL